MKVFFAVSEHRSRILVFMGLAGGASLLLAIFALLQSSLGAVADKANAIDTRRSYEAMQAAVDTSAGSLAEVTKEDSVWDDAVTRLYQPAVDGGWLYSTFGALTKDNANYDGVYVTEADGRVLWGYANGEPGTVTDVSQMGPSSGKLFADYRKRDTQTQVPASALVRTPSGLITFISVGLIEPSSPATHVPPGMKRYLVMTRKLDQSVLDGYSHTFNIADIRLGSAGADAPRPHLALKDASGAVIGQLSWKPALPGIEAARAALPQIHNSMLLIGALMAAFVGAMTLSLRRLGASERRARLSALTDALTGLPNRRALMERLETQQARHDFKTGAALVLIDLDGFKEINDTFGHETGDRLIVLLAERLKAEMPEGALLVRAGGDEFALLLLGRGSSAAAARFAETVTGLLSEAMTIGIRTLRIGASIGIATARSGSCGGEELLRRADLAMYAIKAAGKNAIGRYSPDLDAARAAQAQLEGEIRAGLDGGEFEVHYQPIVDISGRAAAVEALVRWPRRPAGPIGPDAFIPAAESSGLIGELGLFVLERACRDFLPFDGIKLSVNISPAQFRDTGFEDKVAAVLAETGFPSHRLELEVTEGYLIDHPERATAVIAALKAMGLSVALDDFGTGYTSIAYLQRYGFSRIKIDKSLCGHMDDDKTRVLVAGAVFMANGLDMAVTAEGVETEDQAVLLRAAGCHYLQGYLYSRPMALPDLLTKGLIGAPAVSRLAG